MRARLADGVEVARRGEHHHVVGEPALPQPRDRRGRAHGRGEHDAGRARAAQRGARGLGGEARGEAVVHDLRGGRVRGARIAHTCAAAVRAAAAPARAHAVRAARQGARPPRPHHDGLAAQRRQRAPAAVGLDAAHAPGGGCVAT